MTEVFAVAAVVLTGSSGVPALVSSRGRPSASLSTLLMLLGSACGLFAAIDSFSVGPSVASFAWSVPGGQLAVRVDGLAAMFLLQIFLVAPLGSIYGLAYWSDEEHPESARKVRAFYGLTTAGMALVVIAQNAILFLVGWEVMALAAFLLISTEDARAEVRESGLVYLVATRFGTLCLFAMFTLLQSVNGSFDFSAPRLDAASPIASAMMVLALAGFGLKAGMIPLHLWLPGAHANAPTHVSALMSGVLIKMGIYGIARFISFFPSPPIWWGTVLLILGSVSGVLGVLFAIAQHDVKRLLAYHSVENIGIILMGLGMGLLGRSYSNEAVFVLGIGGGLLHVWNHGLFKALLFLSAGSVIHSTRTREIDQLGGLAKSMPWTALAFIIGAAAISGLPPLNGFVSEFLVYLAFLRGSVARQTLLWSLGAFSVPILALIGALALACFVKVVGAVFLGQPRTDRARAGHECSPAMLVPMGVLGAGCVVIGLGPWLIGPVLDRAMKAWAPVRVTPRVTSAAPLTALSVLSGFLALSVCFGLYWTRRARRSTAPVPTWDCGYAAPASSMQYTSSSFADMIVGSLATLLRVDKHVAHVRGVFPAKASFHTHLPDIILDRAVLPAARFVGRSLSWFRWVQRGAVQLYLLYVLATLVVLLVIWR
jgi:hydrogenase-4 component B